ncbi:MAG: YigZ family protein, partial [Anaerolineae bacterium]|nr:YigZ family protein [Anaerolineae bacterium]
MMVEDSYRRPAATFRTEHVVARSRFIATITLVESVEQARAFLTSIQNEMPDASHHVYAYVVGHGSSVIEGMSDAGEPSGSAGPPVMAVLRGSKLGDTLIVVTRYFGGTKLGVGGLVRAYSDAARAALLGVTIEERIPRVRLTVDATYALYERIVRLVQSQEGNIEATDFTADVHLTLVLPLRNLDLFQSELRELSAGRIQAAV